MTLEELEQVKKDFNQGIMISKGTWEKVLDHAIDAEESLRALTAAESAYASMHDEGGE